MSIAVVDGSVLVAALIDSGPEGRWAEDLLLRHQMAAPHLAVVESSNVLRRAVLRNDVTAEEATQAHADLLDYDIELFPFAPFADRVWELRGNLTAYDAWYVAIAEALGCELLTLDRRLAASAGVRCRVQIPPET